MNARWGHQDAHDLQAFEDRCVWRLIIVWSFTITSQVWRQTWSQLLPCLLRRGRAPSHVVTASGDLPGWRALHVRITRIITLQLARVLLVITILLLCMERSNSKRDWDVNTKIEYKIVIEWIYHDISISICSGPRPVYWDFWEGHRET